MNEAIEAAEAVRVTGNMAFSAGSLENALTLYQVASRHLAEARKLQTGVPSVCCILVFGSFLFGISPKSEDLSSGQPAAHREATFISQDGGQATRNFPDFFG